MVETHILDSLRQAGTATLATQLFNRGFRSVVLAGVAPLSRGRSFAGPARTLRFVPAREDTSVGARLRDPAYPHRALIESLTAGDVVVVDARGDRTTGILGDILVARVAALGGAALVTDGCYRDMGRIATLDLPVYGAGGNPGAHLLRHEAVDADVPIGCGGVQIRPGDLIVGDDDGVVCVPVNLAAEVGAAGAEQTQVEAFVYEKVAAGTPLPGAYPPSDELLAEFRAARS